ncbi:hypothetical protein ANCCAN_10471 [Ancylostoma caninum]|uniref:Uncharacterized protein n=1 Tax=Ancylostoma caninum TaxID=29170 RepID=A0A368GGT4_ANCCA|nr:hypothetical protein ANCCAN_10471 [Ancylostoma caninum]
MNRDQVVFAICTKEVFIDLRFVFSAWSMVVLCQPVRESLSRIYLRRSSTSKTLVRSSQTVKEGRVN